ncbi:hypothetical protein [Senegalia massiliensis]|uniref:hypothetical protein n=1 Tax=Senegalia massiliensis TaxID=1720316 RepID=UPI00102F96A4|nr:hypothetical protein [Senegalia massiliensis]
MKIEKITLFKQEMAEQDNELILKVTEEETVPCVITNKALKVANELGTTRSSLVTDLMQLGGSVDEDKVGDVEDIKILTSIYVGYIGGQILKGVNVYEEDAIYTFDEFVERYNDSSMEKVLLYQKLITAEKENKFADKIERSTNKTPNKGEKK